MGMPLPVSFPPSHIPSDLEVYYNSFWFKILEIPSQECFFLIEILLQANKAFHQNLLENQKGINVGFVSYILWMHKQHGIGLDLNSWLFYWASTKAFLYG